MANCLVEPKVKLVCRVILDLSRYCGLRTPSETRSLRWDNIDWEMNRRSIPEPLVEPHEGQGVRSCPIFPELRSILVFWFTGNWNLPPSS
jgi:integrase